MAKVEFVRARVEPTLKRDAEQLFEQLGLTTTQAITLFYKQVALRKGLPFPIELPNAETLRTFRATDNGKGLTAYKNADEMFDDLDI